MEPLAVSLRRWLPFLPNLPSRMDMLRFDASYSLTDLVHLHAQVGGLLLSLILSVLWRKNKPIPRPTRGLALHCWDAGRMKRRMLPLQLLSRQKSEIRQLAREDKHACSSCPNGFPWPPEYVATDFCVILADLQRPAASSCYLRMKPGFMAFMPQSFWMTS